MARPASLKKGQWDQFERVLFASNVTAEEILQITEKPELLKVMLEALRSNLIHSLFTPTSAQITCVRKLNFERSWGFTDEDFAEAEASVPNWPAGILVSVTLVPYLPEGNCIDGVEHTFQELWKATVVIQEGDRPFKHYDKKFPERLRLLKDIEHPAQDKPVLRWEVIDLSCNRNREPVSVRNCETSPHAGLLAAAMLHPEWIKAMNGDNIPYVCVPGYEVNFLDRNMWNHLPNLSFDKDVSEILLDRETCNSSCPEFSVPSFVRG